MRKTGIFNLIENRIIGSLVDYVTGIEAGLDSNGRKIEVDTLMENLIESYIQSWVCKGITCSKKCIFMLSKRNGVLIYLPISNQR